MVLHGFASPQYSADDSFHPQKTPLPLILLRVAPWSWPRHRPWPHPAGTRWLSPDQSNPTPWFGNSIMLPIAPVKSRADRGYMLYTKLGFPKYCVGPQGA